MTHDYFLLQGSALARLLSSVDYFLLSKKVEGRSPATLEWLQVSLEDLDRFLRSKGPKLIAEELTPLHIRAWLAHLQEKGLAKSTINTKYRALSSFVSWCLAEGIIKDSPLMNISPPKVGKPAIPIFRPEHIKALLFLCPPNYLWGVQLSGLPAASPRSYTASTYADGTNLKSGTIIGGRPVCQDSLEMSSLLTH